MNNRTKVHDLERFNASSSSLRGGGGGAVGSFFIPGITAKARCLSSSESVLQTDDYLCSSSSSSSLNYEEGNSSSRRRNNMVPARERSDRCMYSLKDARFSKMMMELTAARKEADEARVAALLVKERFENEASSSTTAIQNLLHDDPIFNELQRFCNRAAWEMGSTNARTTMSNFVSSLSWCWNRWVTVTWTIYIYFPSASLDSLTAWTSNLHLLSCTLYLPSTDLDNKLKH